MNSNLQNNTFIGFLGPKTVGKEVSFIILYFLLHYKKNTWKWDKKVILKKLNGGVAKIFPPLIYLKSIELPCTWGMLHFFVFFFLKLKNVSGGLWGLKLIRLIKMSISCLNRRLSSFYPNSWYLMFELMFDLDPS